MVDKIPLIVGVGELLWDVYPDARRPGGAPANVVAHAARLGARSGLVTGVGQDEDGDALLHVLKGWGVDTAGVQRVANQATGTVGITLDAQGVPRFRCSSNTAFDHLEWNDAAEDLSRRADAVVVGTLAQRHVQSRGMIRRFLDEAHQAVVVFDVNFRQWTATVQSAVQETIQKANVLKVNQDELRQLRKLWPSRSTDEIYLMHLVEEHNLMAAALTLGGQGCLLTDGDTLVKEPGLAVDVADTTGCGDAFTAVMTLGLMQGWPLGVIARCANALAAFTATREGAVPESTQDEAVAFMNRHGIDWYFS